MEQKFYKCNHCGNMIAFVKASGVPVMCCGEPMEEMVPGTTDAALEKHVPDVTVEGNCVKVKVGSVEHPMLEEHYIEWIALVSDKKECTKYFNPGEVCETHFKYIPGSTLYAYCNKHGLWKTDVE